MIAPLGPLPSRDPKRDEVLKAKINELIDAVNAHDAELTGIAAQLAPDTPEQDPDGPVAPPAEDVPQADPADPAGPGSPVPSGEPATPAPTVGLRLTCTDAQGVPVTEITTIKPHHVALVRAYVTENGVAVSDHEVTFSVDHPDWVTYLGGEDGGVWQKDGYRQYQVSMPKQSGILVVEAIHKTATASLPLKLIGPASPDGDQEEDPPVIVTTQPPMTRPTVGTSGGGGGGGSTPDPTSLAASNRQMPDFAAYEASGVRALARGSVFTESGLKHLKLTSATAPASNSAAGHDYSSGGGQVSHLHTTDRVTCYYYSSIGNSHILTDVTTIGGDPAIVAGSDRNPPATLPSSRDLQFSFSANPSTPTMAYYVKSGGTNGYTRIAKLDTTVGVMADVVAGVFPKDLSASMPGDMDWMHHDFNDRWFVAQDRSKTTIVAWDSQADTMISVTAARLNSALGGTWALDEPHLDNDGAYCYISAQKNGTNQFVRWTLATDTLTDAGFTYSHQTGARSRAIYHTGNNELAKYTPATNVGATTGTSDTSDGDTHKSTQWVQSNADVEDDYALYSGHGAGSVGYQNGARLGNGTAGLTFTLSSGSIYWCTPSFNFDDASVTHVAQSVSGDVNTFRGYLTSRGSLGAVTGAGEFFYDSGANRLYIWAFESLDLTVEANKEKLAAWDADILSDYSLHLRTVNGTDSRHVGHHFATANSYYAQAHGTLSRGGHGLMYESDMNLRGGRTDAFYIQLPTS